MGLATDIALTFMRRRNSKVPAFTAIVSVLGVSFGVAAFLVVVTVFQSFENELRRILSAANPNLLAHNAPFGFSNVDKTIESVKPYLIKPYERISKFEYNEGLLSHGPLSGMAIFKAIEGDKAANAPDLIKMILPVGALSLLNAEYAIKTASQMPDVILGTGLAAKLGVKLYDEVTMTTAAYGKVNKNRHQKLRVAGILSLGLAQYDEKLALMNFKDGVSLFGSPGAAKGFEVRFKDMNDALVVANKMRAHVEFPVKAWQEVDQNIFEQIERDGAAIKLIVFVITLVAGFNIIVTLSLSVMDRSKQIAILRSFGASRWFVVRVFVIMGLILGAAGAVLGVAMGLVVLHVFSGFELGELKSFYWLNKIPVEYNLSLMFGAIAVAMILAFLGALYPAWKAGRVSPLVGLRP